MALATGAFAEVDRYLTESAEAAGRYTEDRHKHGQDVMLGLGADPKDLNLYCVANLSWVPQQAHWSHLLANARQPTIGKLLDDAMLAIEHDNPSLKGVLPKDYAHP